MSDFRDLIQKAREPENQKDGLPAKEIVVSPVEREREEEVNLSIKVPKRLRRHWVSEAKKQDTTLTAAIMGALREKFGEP